MKRLHIVTNPITTADLSALEDDSYTDIWELKVKRLETKRLRRFKRQMA